MPSSEKTPPLKVVAPTNFIEEDKSGTHTPPRKADQKDFVASQKAVTLPARHSPSSIPKPSISSYGATRTRFGFGTSPGPSTSTGPPKVPPPPPVFTKTQTALAKSPAATSTAGAPATRKGESPLRKTHIPQPTTAAAARYYSQSNAPMPVHHSTSYKHVASSGYGRLSSSTSHR